MRSRKCHVSLESHQPYARICLLGHRVSQKHAAVPNVMGSDMHRTTMEGHAPWHVHAAADRYTAGVHTFRTRSCWTQWHQPWRAGNKSGKHSAACPRAAAPTAHIAHVPSGSTQGPTQVSKPRQASQRNHRSAAQLCWAQSAACVRPKANMSTQLQGRACDCILPGHTMQACNQVGLLRSACFQHLCHPPNPQYWLTQDPNNPGQSRPKPLRSHAALRQLAARDSRCTQPWTGAVLACPGTKAAPTVAVHRRCRLRVLPRVPGKWRLVVARTLASKNPNTHSQLKTKQTDPTSHTLKGHKHLTVHKPPHTRLVFSVAWEAQWHMPCPSRPVPFPPRPGNSKQANRQPTNTYTNEQTPAQPLLLVFPGNTWLADPMYVWLKRCPQLASSSAERTQQCCPARMVTMLPTPNQPPWQAAIRECKKLQDGALTAPCHARTPPACRRTSGTPHPLSCRLPPKGPLPNSTSACVQNEMHLAGCHACNMFDGPMLGADATNMH